jgi:hypothetical protein
MRIMVQRPFVATALNVTRGVRLTAPPPAAETNDKRSEVV